QTGGQVAVFVGVTVDVGVEKVQIDAPHVQLPDAGKNAAVPRLDRDHDRVAVLHTALFQGKRSGVDLGVVLALPAALVDDLREVTLVVEQTDGHERHAQIGGTL